MSRKKEEEEKKMRVDAAGGESAEAQGYAIAIGYRTATIRLGCRGARICPSSRFGSSDVSLAERPDQGSPRSRALIGFPGSLLPRQD